MIVEIMVSGWNGGASFMSAFSIQKAIDHFDTEQMKKWCSRLYNKSGIFKYIYPFLNEMPVECGRSQTDLSANLRSEGFVESTPKLLHPTPV